MRNYSEFVRDAVIQAREKAKRNQKAYHDLPFK